MSSPKVSLTNLPAIEGGEPVFTKRFRFIEPTLPPLNAVLEYYRPVYASGLLTNASLVNRFESEVAERLQVAHCIAVSSCTSGLMLTLRALDLEGEVILPSFTFFATGHAVVWNRLRPVFADCDPDTWTLDPADVERKVTERTCAIMGVHLYGNPCDIEGLTTVAGGSKIKLIFDSAHAFGSRRRGKPVGQFGDAEIFSLTPTKLLVCGEGGLITTNDAVLARRVRAARNYGDAGTYDPELTGLSARMSEFQAALGLAGLHLLDRKVKRHNAIARQYARALCDTAGVRFQKVQAEDESTFKDFSVHVNSRLLGRTRDEMTEALRAENIETRKYFYPPLHRQKLFAPTGVKERAWPPHEAGNTQDRSAQKTLLPNTEWISDGILSLPIYQSLADSSIEKIAFAIKRLARTEHHES